ncbi:MAG: DNA ligase, partial [Candidatus Diapherotrites archaeon]|nr:DNA ligase [Candidatus Diapherotrites archaeon]
ERRERLKKLIGKGEVLQLTDAIETDSPKELEKYFQESVSEGLEGIIAKDLKAKYIAGARKFAWIKLKRSYRGELSDTIDCVVIGYFKGRGKRTQFGLGALLTAVYNSEKDVFESIAKLGTGISEEQLKELFSLLSKIKTAKKSARVVTELEPDEWVEPKIVLEVKADEITKSPLHSAGKEKEEGYALRFPRMQKIRTDRKAEEATTVKEIIKMFKAQRTISTNVFEGAERK